MVAIGSAVDSYVTYKILNIIATDWVELPAYKLGIIDKNGKALKKSWELKTSAEKNAYTPLHILVFNLKRLLNKVPGTARKLGTVAAAMWLLKEAAELSDNDFKILKEHVMLVESEVPTNVSAGGLNIAGLDNNPPVRKKQPDDKFAGHPVFDVSSDIYHGSNPMKKKWERWNKFVPLSDDVAIVTETLREYAINNPKDAIILRDKNTGLMRFIKHTEK